MDNAKSSICVHEAHGMYTISGGEGEILTMPKKEGFPGGEALVVDGMVGQELVACFACG